MTDLPPIYPDARLDDADWIKRAWDLPWRDADSLRAHLAAKGQSVESFKLLPVYRFNVEKLPWLKDL